MIAWHPLAGRADAKEFHLDSGRLCVMLSRHRVACIIVSRSGVEARLQAAPLTGDRILGIERDAGFEGWQAHVQLLSALRTGGRNVQI